MRGISWLAYNRLASQVGLCCTEYGMEYILDLVVKLPKHVILEVTDVYLAVFTYVLSH